MSGSRTRRHSRGQTLVEFALVFPVFIALVGGIVQFGMVFWAQNTLTQVVRDTGRWAASQQGCSASGVGLAAQANAVAANSSLAGYSSAAPWTATDFTTASFDPSGDTAVAGYTTSGSIGVAWVKDADPASQGCPPKDNQAVYHVTIKVNHVVPTFFPGMQYLPGLGTCNASGCNIVVSSSARFRMEPKP